MPEFNSHAFQITDDEGQNAKQVRHISPLAAWDMGDMTTPGRSPHLGRGYFKPYLDDKGMRVELNQVRL